MTIPKASRPATQETSVVTATFIQTQFSRATIGALRSSGVFQRDAVVGTGVEADALRTAGSPDVMLAGVGTEPLAGTLSFCPTVIRSVRKWLAERITLTEVP